MFEIEGPNVVELSFLPVVWVEVIPPKEIHSTSAFPKTHGKVLSQVKFVLDLKSGPLTGVGVQSVVLIRHFVLVLASVDDQFLSKENSLVEGQDFWGVFIVHVFAFGFECFQVNLVENVLEGVPPHPSQNEQLVVDDVEGVAPEFVDEQVLDFLYIYHCFLDLVFVAGFFTN